MTRQVRWARALVLLLLVLCATTRRTMPLHSVRAVTSTVGNTAERALALVQVVDSAWPTTPVLRMQLCHPLRWLKLWTSHAQQLLNYQNKRRASAKLQR